MQPIVFQTLWNISARLEKEVEIKALCGMLRSECVAIIQIIFHVRFDPGGPGVVVVVVSLQCDQSGRFLKVHEKKILWKLAQKFGGFSSLNLCITFEV